MNKRDMLTQFISGFQSGFTAAMIVIIMLLLIIGPLILAGWIYDKLT